MSSWSKYPSLSVSEKIRIWKQPQGLSFRNTLHLLLMLSSHVVEIDYILNRAYNIFITDGGACRLLLNVDIFLLFKHQ